MEQSRSALSIRIAGAEPSLRSTPRMLSPAGPRARDGRVALLLFAATTVYLCLFPHSLSVGDEARFLYEAKRIRDGEVMYRDFFQITAPLPSYVMAGLYWLFGTSVATARISMAVLHAATGVLLYAAARRLDVRPELAAPIVLAYLAICQALYPFASWHWFGTLFSTLLLVVLLVVPWAERPRSAFIPGLATGIMIGVQQQKGFVLAAAVGILLALDHLIDRRYSTPDPWRRLATRLVFFAAGMTVVVAPLLATFGLLAGPATLYAALIRFPLENYRGHIQSNWGTLMPMGEKELAQRTFPIVLKYSPAALVLPIIWSLANLLRGRDRQRVRALTVLIVWCAFSVLSIWYYPDLIHIAFIAAGFWLCAAVGLEWILSAVQPPAVARLAGALVAVIVSAPLVLHLGQYVRLRRQQCAVSHDTAFGRVDFPTRWEPIFVDRVRALLAQSPSAELFCHSPVTSPYLTTGGRNPTPYQYLEPSVSPEEHTRNTLSILEQRRVPYVISSPVFTRRDDPIALYIEEHYEVVPIPEMNGLGEWPAFRLYRRKDHAAAADS